MQLDSQSYEFGDLEKKYSEFQAPAFKILIESTDVVSDEYMAIDGISVEISVDKASFFSFSVVNAYEIDKSAFKWQEDYFQVGKKIEIKFGYIDKFATVFEGYITSISYSFSPFKGPTVEISGMDASFLMMKGKKSSIWLDRTHSDVVSEIASNYGLKTEVTATDIKFISIVQNNQTDYDFIRYLANKNSFEIFVMGYNLYFRKVNEEKTKLVTLEINKNIIDFEYTEDLADQIGGVVIRGYNLKKEEIESSCATVTSINAGSKDGVALLKELDGDNTKHYINEQISSSDEGNEIAKSFLTKNSMNFIKGEGSTLGVPEIIAGRFIEVKGMFGTSSKLLYIKSATHRFDSNGYNTRFKFGGNSV